MVIFAKNRLLVVPELKILWMGVLIIEELIVDNRLVYACRLSLRAEYQTCHEQKNQHGLHCILLFCPADMRIFIMNAPAASPAQNSQDSCQGSSSCLQELINGIYMREKQLAGSSHCSMRGDSLRMSPDWNIRSILEQEAPKEHSVTFRHFDPSIQRGAFPGDSLVLHKRRQADRNGEGFGRQHSQSHAEPKELMVQLYLYQLLAQVLALEQPNEGLRRTFDPLRDGFVIFDPALDHMTAQFLQRLRPDFHVI